MKYFCEVEVYQRTTAADWAIRIVGAAAVVVVFMCIYFHWETL